MKVLFFGVLSELAAKSADEFDFAGTVQEFRKMMSDQYSGFSDQKYQIAANQKVVQDDHVLEGNEELALLPPFTGG